MPISITGLFAPSGGAGAFDLYAPEDIQAGNVNVALTLIAGGKVQVSGILGEIVPQTGAITPVHSATEGTFYWDTAANKLYVNNNGTTGWTEVMAAASAVVGPASATDTAICLFDFTTGKLIKNSLVTIDVSGHVLLSGAQELRLRDANSAIWSASTGSVRFKATTLIRLMSPAIQFWNAGLTNQIFAVNDVASAVNYIEIANATAAAPVVPVTAVGTSVDIGINLVPKGAGDLQLGGSASTGTGGIVRAASPTLTTPVIGDFTSATHSHQSVAGGGTLDAAAIAAGTLAVARGGTNLGSGTSGGVLGFTAAGTLASSAALTANGVVVGGGAGATPTSTAAGTTGQVLRGVTSSAPAWGAVPTSGSIIAHLEAINTPSTDYMQQDVRLTVAGTVDGGAQAVPPIPIDVFDADASTDEFMMFRGKLAPTYAGGGITVRGVVRFSSAITGQAYLGFALYGLRAASIIAAKNHTFSYVPVTADTTNPNAGKPTLFTLSIATTDGLQGGDPVILLVYRDANGTNGTDDAAGDCEIESVELAES